MAANTLPKREDHMPLGHIVRIVRGRWAGLTAEVLMNNGGALKVAIFTDPMRSAERREQWVRRTSVTTTSGPRYGASR